MENKEITSNVENVVIIGSGPAGYTAAIYAARANLQPLLVTGFNSGGIPGGQLMTTTFVENYPGFPDGVLGPELMDLMKAQAERWGTNLYESDVISINTDSHPFELKTLEGTIKSNSIIIATGASANRLGVINEDKFWSKGISACAICDGATPQFRDEELAVIGGGDSACEEAAYLTKYGSKVHLIVRSEKLRASAAMVDRVKANPKIEIHWNTKVDKADGSEWLERIETIHSQEGKGEINIKGLFYAIGHTPNTKFLGNQIDLDNKGYIACKSGRPETSIEGIFAAGDVVDSEWRQGVTAAGTGCMAALATERWLAEKNLAKIIVRETPEPEKKLNSSDFNDVTSEDVCLANIEISNYSSNLIPCQVSLSSISKNGRGFCLEIYGSEGSLILKSENQKDYVHGFNLKYSNNENKIQNLTADSRFNFEKTWTDGRIAPVMRIQNLWAQRIINGTPVIPGLCEGLASHKVCEAIRESSKSGLSIKI